MIDQLYVVKADIISDIYIYIYIYSSIISGLYVYEIKYFFIVDGNMLLPCIDVLLDKIMDTT